MAVLEKKYSADQTVRSLLRSVFGAVRARTVARIVIARLCFASSTRNQTCKLIATDCWTFRMGTGRLENLSCCGCTIMDKSLYTWLRLCSKLPCRIAIVSIVPTSQSRDSSAASYYTFVQSKSHGRSSEPKVLARTN